MTQSDTEAPRYILHLFVLSLMLFNSRNYSKGVSLKTDNVLNVPKVNSCARRSLLAYFERIEKLCDSLFY